MKSLVLYQVIKFSMVGMLNTLIDLGILNILIWLSGIASGPAYSIFKGISFTAAVVNSYFCNKFWTFRKERDCPRRGLSLSSCEKEAAASEGDFVKFLAVALAGLLINVGVASLVVNLIGPCFGLSEKIWANAGAVAASLIGLAWNFLGYKFWVFKI